MNDTAKMPNRQARDEATSLLSDGTKDASPHPLAVDHVAISRIIQDRTVWPREDYDADALARYRECPEALPPVHVDQATGILLDGFHRLRVHQEGGADTVAVVFEDCQPERYLARALELNRHGTPISREDRDRAIVQLGQQGFTQAEIATVVGISQKRVSQLIARYSLGHPNRARLTEALRLREAGASWREAEAASGIPKSTIERAEKLAKARKVAIDQHRQTRPGLISVLRYPERGPWGKGRYKGNCSGYVLLDLIDHFRATSAFDPMEGSGTTREVCADLGVVYEGRDLHAGFDLLASPLPDGPFDLVFWHPPYWPGFRYSHHPNDLSSAKSLADFLERVRTGFERLRPLVAPKGHLVIMIGDGRKNGVFYPIHSEIIGWGLMPLHAVLIKDGAHERQGQHFRYGPAKFIPTLHEYVLIFKQGGTQ